MNPPGAVSACDRVLDGRAAAVDQLVALEEGWVSSRDLTEAYLDRASRANGRLRAFVTLDDEAARREADASDRERRDGRQRGPLHGLPISVKDSFATAGLRTTSGLEDRAEHVPNVDAVAVARVRAAGAVLLGKTNLPAGVSGQETANALVGRTVNPWDIERTPGGSSGGSAAALAAGLTGLELGSDSGGSIRQPAHCCGVFGHVATHGLVPQRGHLPSVPVNDVGALLDVFAVGPMARDARDLALALDVMAGEDPLGPVAWRLALPPAPKPLEQLRVAVAADDRACPISAEVRRRIEAAVAALERHGAEVVDEAWPPFDVAHAMDVAFRLWVASQADDDDGSGGADDDLSRARTESLAMNHGEWLELDAERRELTRSWHSMFTTVDVAIVPISPVTALRHDPAIGRVHEMGHRLRRVIDVDGRTRPYLDQVRWNVLVGMAGLPATAAPIGLGASGLPVGAQVVGPRHADHTTIAVAGALSRAAVGGEPPWPRQ